MAEPLTLDQLIDKHGAGLTERDTERLKAAMAEAQAIERDRVLRAVLPHVHSSRMLRIEAELDKGKP